MGLQASGHLGDALSWLYALVLHHTVTARTHTAIQAEGSPEENRCCHQAQEKGGWDVTGPGSRHLLLFAGLTPSRRSICPASGL